MIHKGDCLDILPTLEDESVDLLLTDPPYGIGFMGKDWDKALPDKTIWAECLRVLKPGAFAFVMSIPRSDCLSRMIISLEDAGFRTNFTPIYWAYASGFPKAQNIGKMVDKRLGAEREVVGYNSWDNGINFDYSGDGHYQGKWDKRQLSPITQPSSPQAKALDGSYGGFQPKPAVEVIIVCMKPLSEKTFVDQALKNRKGITWLDSCRIPYDLTGKRPSAIIESGGEICQCNHSNSRANNVGRRNGQREATKEIKSSSFAVGSADMPTSEKEHGIQGGDTNKGNTSCSGEISVGSTITNSNMFGSGKERTGQSPKDMKFTTSMETKQTTDLKICNVCGLEVIDTFIESAISLASDQPSGRGRFPANLLVSDDVLNDGRVRVSKYAPSKPSVGKSHFGSSANFDRSPACNQFIGDSGSFSRYFDLDKCQFLIVPKASKSEKNKGLDMKREPIEGTDGVNSYMGVESAGIRKLTTKNNHPTVKPLKLMSYLITLGSREGDVILDPFLGSGTTALACQNLGRECIGIELEEKYVEIATKRCSQGVLV